MGGGCCIGDFCCVVNLGCGFCCIAEISCSDCCVGYSSAPRDSVDHEKEVAEELANMRKRADEEAQREENDVLSKIDERINAFLRETEEYNRQNYGGKQLNINIEVLRERIDKLREEVSGFIGRKLSDRLQLKDKVLSLILDGRNKENRKQKFEDFYQDIMLEAKEALVEKIREMGEEQIAVIDDAINQRLDEVDEAMASAEIEYRALLKAYENDKMEVTVKKVDLEYRLRLCELMLYEVDATERVCKTT